MPLPCSLVFRWLAMRNPRTTNSASQHAPGHQMQNNTPSSTTSPGASSYAPGQKMQNDTTGSVTGQGASSYAPGQQKKLPTDATGTTTQRK